MTLTEKIKPFVQQIIEDADKGNPQAQQVIAFLRNPTAEGAMRQLKKQLGFEPSSPRVALAAVHKARLSWSGSTSEMIEESKRWLVDNGFSPTPSPYVEM